jgi:hypothetical protein
MWLMLLQLLHLVLFSIIAGQSFFYLIGGREAIRLLSAPAFIEQRKITDRIIAGRLRITYILALMLSLVLISIWLIRGGAFPTIFIVLSTLCLIIDLSIAVRGNIPLNREIQTWATSQYPANWNRIRSRWLRFFAWRELVSIVGLLLLLMAALWRHEILV